jgi:hypothetical protein
LWNDVRIELPIVEDDTTLKAEVAEIISIEANASISPQRAQREY